MYPYRIDTAESTFKFQFSNPEKDEYRNISWLLIPTKWLTSGTIHYPSLGSTLKSGVNVPPNTRGDIAHGTLTPSFTYSRRPILYIFDSAWVDLLAFCIFHIHIYTRVYTVLIAFIMASRAQQIAGHLNWPRGMLAGQVAIITGSGQGIGAEAARLFANEGAKVIVADIDAGRTLSIDASSNLY